MSYFTGVMRKIGAFIWYQTLHLEKWSDHTPLIMDFFSDCRPHSSQSQYRYVTPHFLLLHLDENMKNTPQIKRSMVGVLKETVAIAADGAVG